MTNTNITTNPAQEKGPLERCAELATWHQIEGDPAQKERLAGELAQCVMQAAKEEADRKVEQEAKEKAEAEKKADAEKAAKVEKKERDAKDKTEAETKAEKAAEHATWEKDMLERAERDREQRSAAPEMTRERTIEVPENIRNNPMYQQILEEQRATQARLVTEQAERMAAEAKATNYQGLANQARMEAAEAREERSEQQQQHEARQDPATPGIEKDNPDPYEQAAKELNAKPMKEGQEIEGEVVDIAKVDGKNYYVVEQDGERLAVPVGDKPEHDKGDEITAARSKEGFETGEAYGYGR